MTFSVLVTKRAEKELNQAADWISHDSPALANRWFNGFVKSIQSLSPNPERCPLARENAAFSFELSQLLYGRKHFYRALFTIRKSEIQVLAIRHAAQRQLTPDGIEGECDPVLP